MRRAGATAAHRAGWREAAGPCVPYDHPHMKRLAARTRRMAT